MIIDKEFKEVSSVEIAEALVEAHPIKRLTYVAQVGVTMIEFDVHLRRRYSLDKTKTPFDDEDQTA